MASSTWWCRTAARNSTRRSSLSGSRCLGRSTDGGAAPLAGRARVYIVVAVLAIEAVLLFAGLGHYALWDDEANTALSAKAVLRTGDTSARVDDHNVLAYRGGAELRDLKLRYVPPLQAYVAAP